MQIAFFPGCLVDMFYPGIGIAAVHVLERLGCDITVPEKQICCGQPLLNSGYAPETMPIIEQMVNAYADYDCVVSLTGSCMFAIQHDYTPYLQDKPALLEKQQRLAGNIYEFSDFIYRVLGVTDASAVLGSKLEASATYHKSCHLTRLLGIEEAPINLLKSVDGIDYVEMAFAERCCGFGGTFSVKEPEISCEMVHEKAQTILDTGADVAVFEDAPCLLNVQGELTRMRDEGETSREVRCMHLAEVLDNR